MAMHSKTPVKASIADVLGPGVSVSDVEITATSINSTTGPAEVEVQETIKNVGTAEEAQGIADGLDASVTNGALNDALKANAPGNGLDDALVPKTVDSSTDVVGPPSPSTTTPPPCDPARDCSGRGDTSDMDASDGSECKYQAGFGGGDCSVAGACST